jgi:hypothetical protein
MNRSYLSVKMIHESNLENDLYKKWIKHIGNGARLSTTQKRESSFTIRLQICWQDSRGLVYSF